MKNVEKDGHDTLRTVNDCVVKLRELRRDLISKNNEDESHYNDEELEENESDDSNRDEDTDNRSVVFKAHACHVHLLQLCNCRSEASCNCIPDERIKDTIFYRRDKKIRCRGFV